MDEQSPWRKAKKRRGGNLNYARPRKFVSPTAIFRIMAVAFRRATANFSITMSRPPRKSPPPLPPPVLGEPAASRSQHAIIPLPPPARCQLAITVITLLHAKLSMDGNSIDTRNFDRCYFASINWKVQFRSRGNSRCTKFLEANLRFFL